MIKKPYRSVDIVNLLNLIKPKIMRKAGKKQVTLMPVFEITMKATPSNLVAQPGGASAQQQLTKISRSHRNIFNAQSN
jgi:hypothetical protein